jgi:hypothetical protein
MGRRIGSTDDAEWAALFTGFQRSAYRLEGLQHYAEPDEAEAFARFLNGEDPKLDMSWWLSLAAEHKAAGRNMTRVRVIVEPITDYTRFELAHYPAMDAAGETIRVITTAGGSWPAGVPPHDYWLFDERDLWLMNYAPDGSLLFAELVDEPDEVAQHIRWRDVALAQSVPLRTYLSTLARAS